MKLFVVAIERGGNVVVVDVDVVKETNQFYFIGKPDDQFRYAFGYSSRVPKDKFGKSPAEALNKYIERRKRDRDDAAAVVAQATSQIADALIVLGRYSVATVTL